jgi:hypothetical protein
MKNPEKILRSLIRESLEEVMNEISLDEEALEEERISNKDAAELVSQRENFVGSHTYGEDLGGLGKMYVAYSYGEQHPLYLYDAEKERWYHNYNDYIVDGEPNSWTRKHLEDLRPGVKTQGRPKSFLMKKIAKFKKKHGLGDNVHTDLEPGEK